MGEEMLPGLIHCCSTASLAVYEHIEAFKFFHLIGLNGEGLGVIYECVEYICDFRHALSRNQASEMWYHSQSQSGRGEALSTWLDLIVATSRGWVCPCSSFHGSSKNDNITVHSSNILMSLAWGMCKMKNDT